jgi:hypothetical protein
MTFQQIIACPFQRYSNAWSQRAIYNITLLIL